MPHTEAYLDIETTGLSCLYADITVIGIYLVNGSTNRMVQLVGKDVSKENLLDVVNGVERIYTYNGSRFDLPFINSSLGVDLDEVSTHHDLMYDCWRCNLRGGLKVVEQRLGISRQLQGINGADAVVLWWRYQSYADLNALNTLLHYNREDVVNLEVLRQRLGVT
jgi:uncharacterized protein YprB with RNaseH-like and TPR domain